MIDFFSYLRRRRGSAQRQPYAGQEAIDLSSMGGAINGTYLDIASVPAAEQKARGKPPPPAAAPPPENAPAAPTADGKRSATGGEAATPHGRKRRRAARAQGRAFGARR